MLTKTRKWILHLNFAQKKNHLRILLSINIKEGHLIYYKFIMQKKSPGTKKKHSREI